MPLRRMLQDIDMNDYCITCLGIPRDSSDAVTKRWVTQQLKDGIKDIDELEEAHCNFERNSSIEETAECYRERCGEESTDDWSGAERSELATTLIMLGQATGAVIFSPISDKIGRKPSNIFARIMYFFTALATVFSPNISVFLVFRFLQGTFQGLHKPSRDSRKSYDMYNSVYRIAPKGTTTSC
ncbi:unnamed protein product [Mytilus edulis]|uniref:Major facilitator superfamily (MFS) profile domain-containing protein n=1 Tax=Mytilus edulis TaxID=6550 RepID=A0A8S3UFQ0_MYTED|nr:unnamed protein product [Mytilus edulis]